MSRSSVGRGRIELRNASYRYPGSDHAVLGPLDLVVEPGEFVLVSGPTGCGKTTLLKCLNGIIPHESAGRLEGVVRVGGDEVREVSHAELCRRAGLVFQSADDQLVAATVEDEVAFGLENLCLSREEIDRRIDETLALVDMAEARTTPIDRLSGGQRQRIAVASVLSMRPSVLALDEPISQLDPLAARSVLGLLRELADRHGITVVLVEHRIAEAASVCDRVVLLDNGSVEMDAGTAAFDDVAVFHRLGLESSVEGEIRAACRLPAGTDLAGVRWMDRDLDRTTLAPAAEGEAFRLDRVEYRYPGGGEPALSSMTLAAARGERLAVVGSNGSGKTTLLSMLTGLVRPSHGVARVLNATGRGVYRTACSGRIGLLFQNPDIMLGARTVRTEIESGPGHLGLSRQDVTNRARQAAERLDVARLFDRAPESVSKGQRLRVAAAALLAMQPEILLLDEPTTGQNRSNVRTLMAELVRDSETTVVFCTHDLGAAAESARRAVIMRDGRVVEDLPARDLVSRDRLLSRSGLAEPPTARMCRMLGLDPVATPRQFSDRYTPGLRGPA